MAAGVAGVMAMAAAGVGEPKAAVIPAAVAIAPASRMTVAAGGNPGANDGKNARPTVASGTGAAAMAIAGNHQ
jgi:hypothetical protein